VRAKREKLAIISAASHKPRANIRARAFKTAAVTSSLIYGGELAGLANNVTGAREMTIVMTIRELKKNKRINKLQDPYAVRPRSVWRAPSRSSSNI
jgi:hypothetical protein